MRFITSQLVMITNVLITSYTI